MSWDRLADWWLVEISEDPAYEDVVTPLLLEVLDPEPRSTYLELGTGDGRVMRAVRANGAKVLGVDISAELASRAGETAVAQLPVIPMRSGAFDGVYSVLTLEHVDDHRTFFEEAARVSAPGGVFVVVSNHPTWTAPDSTPITDRDGEVLWRPGAYLSPGSSEMPAGDVSVTFFHRSMSDLLNAAADAGWSLEHMIEQPHHEFEDQAGIPRLLACRWRLLP
jgi:SAM-dependent methyltransferase